MDIDVLTEVLNESLDEYSRVRSKIRQCLPAFEAACSQLIEQIGVGNRTDVEEKFDELFRMQGVLSKAVFVHDIEIGEKLMAIVRAFERLHDPQAREYWLQRFREGSRWP